jgi:hypothetical protein
MPVLLCRLRSMQLIGNGMSYNRFIALGDSMTEGMQDEIINGRYRGWADRVADVMAKHYENFTYANLAIRGKLVHRPLSPFMLALMM